MFFAIASLGLPGLGNFVGEFLVLLGTYRVAAGRGCRDIGVVAATLYALILVPARFHGAHRAAPTWPTSSPRS